MSNNADVVTEIAEQIREKKQEVRFSTREYVAEYLIDKCQRRRLLHTL